MVRRTGQIRVAITFLALLVVAGIYSPMAATAAKLPSAPRSVKACAAVPGSIKVSWRRPASAGAAKIDRYKVVRWAPEVPRKAYKFSAKKRSAKITGLVPGTTYSFNVRAHNARGWGAASRTVKTVAGGFGTVRGVCGFVAPQLVKPTPSLSQSRFDFGDDPYDAEDLPLLTPGAQTIYAEANTGGSSLLSEMLAFETLGRFDGASLLKTETEIMYDQEGKLTDLLVEIKGSKVGVAVTRAVTFPLGSPPSPETIATLLDRKLDDIRESSTNVAPEDAWVKHVLVVMAYDDDHAEAIETAWLELDEETKADTVVYVVVTDGSDTEVYSDS